MARGDEEARQRCLIGASYIQPRITYLPKKPLAKDVGDALGSFDHD